MKTQHIENIRKQFGVTLSTMSQFNRCHKDEINNINDIFYKKNENEKKLAMLYLLSSGKEDEAVKTFCEKTNLKDPKTFFEQFKVLLITAMIYNPYFYTMAVNYRGLVNAGLTIGEAEKSIQKQTRLENKTIKNEIIKTRFFYRPSKKNAVIQYKSADGTGYNPEQFSIHIIEEINKKYSGEVTFLGNRKNLILELRIQFFDKKTGKPVEILPFNNIKIKLLLGSEKSEKTIVLNQVMNLSTLRSETEMINFIDGLELHSITANEE
ncbi:MAG: hypothetical protein FWD47_08905 [Treponema sp.]|nr:hypothetical protein [Treponema sp.]